MPEASICFVISVCLKCEYFQTKIVAYLNTLFALVRQNVLTKITTIK